MFDRRRGRRKRVCHGSSLPRGGYAAVASGPGMATAATAVRSEQTIVAGSAPLRCRARLGA